MKGILNDAAEIFQRHGSIGGELDAFSAFEPWDVKERTKEQIEYARKWNVELSAEAHPFQRGAMLCDKFIVVQQGGNQVGKSYPSFAQIVAEMTGELPICFRYELGVDTGVNRQINHHNILRFGRWDLEDGILIDHNFKATRDGTWNCGNIMGAGKYPRHMIPPRGSKIWVCTFKQALEEMWWPDLQKFIPERLVDSKRGSNGFSQNPRRAHLLGGEVSFITYEQGFERTEAKKVHRIILDEEPPDRRFYLGCVEHTDYISMRFTPIRGLSWSWRDIFLPAKNGTDPSIALFHATQFDCPWRDPEQIKKKISLLKPWEVEARVFGQYSEQRGKPYFDREKINRWIRRWVPTGQIVRIEPDSSWVEIKNLMVGQVRAQVATLDDHEEEEDTWEIYEQPKENAAYFASVDTSLGQIEGITKDDVLDRNICYVWRCRSLEHDTEILSEDPVMVAAYRSKRRVIPFARNVVAGCRYYNNALLGAETKGESGAVLLATLNDYPFWFTMVTINQQSRQSTTRKGFYTAVNTRQQAFDLAGDWIDRRAGLRSDIPHLPLLKELGAAVVGKAGRPDHTTTGTLDCGIAFGIGLWIYSNARLQIRDNSGYSPKPQASGAGGAVRGRPFVAPEEKPLTLGSKRKR
jgi:phage terminase large subunit-like protein